MLYVQLVAGRITLHRVAPPCATAMTPVGCVGAEETGVVNATVKTTGTLTVMLALGAAGAAESVYLGLSLATEEVVEFVELTKFPSPVYVAFTKTDPAVSDDVTQEAW